MAEEKKKPEEEEKDKKPDTSEQEKPEEKKEENSEEKKPEEKATDESQADENGEGAEDEEKPEDKADGKSDNKAEEKSKVPEAPELSEVDQLKAENLTLKTQLEAMKIVFAPDCMEDAVILAEALVKRDGVEIGAALQSVAKKYPDWKADGKPKG